MMPNPTREDTWLITLALEGRDLGIFDKLEGGEIDSEENKYPPGGLQTEISLGGRKTYGELTASRYYDTQRDHPLMGWMHSVVGGGRGSIGATPLDFLGNPSGSPIVYSGILKTLTRPDIDSESGDAAILALAFTIDGVSP
jgi:hypothetical protein